MAVLTAPYWDHGPFPWTRSDRAWLDDLARGSESVPALVVSIGAFRLRRLGLSVPGAAIQSPEMRLYQKLQESNPDAAHSRYNALIRTLVSFERAAECAS